MRVNLPPALFHTLILRSIKYFVSHTHTLLRLCNREMTQAERDGQSEAIATNLTAMAGLKVPIVTVIMGEGGSGGALGVGMGNRVGMLSRAYFGVVSFGFMACLPACLPAKEDPSSSPTRESYSPYSTVREVATKKNRTPNHPDAVSLSPSLPPPLSLYIYFVQIYFPTTMPRRETLNERMRVVGSSHVISFTIPDFPRGCGVHPGTVQG